MADDIKLPEPHCYIYEWDSHFGTNRSTNRSRWNGRKPDRSFPLYTADQVRAAARALEVENHALRQQVAALSREAYTWSKALEAALAQRVPLTEDQLMACLVESECVGTVRMSHESGPYDITRPSIKAVRLARAIEAAHGIPAPKGGSDE